MFLNLLSSLNECNRRLSYLEEAILGAEFTYGGLHVTVNDVKRIDREICLDVISKDIYGYENAFTIKSDRLEDLLVNSEAYRIGRKSF